MMLSPVWRAAGTRSSLEVMLDIIQQREEEVSDVPPPLPVRPSSKARVPRGRRSLPRNFENDVLSQKEESKMNSVVGGDSTTLCLRVDSLNENDMSEATKKQTLQSTLMIQKCYRGHRAHSYYQELTRGVSILQSFVRGENARKEIFRLRAIIVIQTYMRKKIALKTLERQRTVIYPQPVVIGSLTRKPLNPIENMENPRIGNTKTVSNGDENFQEDHVEVPSSVLTELQRRVVKAEAALQQKEEETAIVQHQLEEFQKRWLDYEANMRSMEETWQNQLRCLQVSLAAAKKSLNTEDVMVISASPLFNSSESDRSDTLSIETRTPNGSTPTPNAKRLENEFEKQKKAFDNEVIALKSDKSIDTLRNLKLRFEMWKKDYKIRLRETKVELKKVSETDKIRRKWWGKMRARVGL